MRAKQETECLARIVYAESRAEPIEGQVAVAWVVVNRVNHGEYPDTVCDVVNQPGQFARARKHGDLEAWGQSIVVASLVLNDLVDDPSNGAIMFHNNSVKPKWSKKYKKTAVIDDHIFYAEKD